jgi:hypothetical protein
VFGPLFAQLLGLSGVANSPAKPLLSVLHAVLLDHDLVHFLSSALFAVPLGFGQAPPRFQAGKPD